MFLVFFVRGFTFIGPLLFLYFLEKNYGFYQVGVFSRIIIWAIISSIISRHSIEFFIARTLRDEISNQFFIDNINFKKQIFSHLLISIIGVIALKILFEISIIGLLSFILLVPSISILNIMFNLYSIDGKSIKASYYNFSFLQLIITPVLFFDLSFDLSILIFSLTSFVISLIIFNKNINIVNEEYQIWKIDHGVINSITPYFLGPGIFWFFTFVNSEYLLGQLAIIFRLFSSFFIITSVFYSFYVSKIVNPQKMIKKYRFNALKFSILMGLIFFLFRNLIFKLFNLNINITFWYYTVISIGLICFYLGPLNSFFLILKKEKILFKINLKFLLFTPIMIVAVFFFEPFISTIIAFSFLISYRFYMSKVFNDFLKK